MKAKTKQQKIKEVIEALEVGEGVDKDNLIITIWGDYDYFISRSFDVHLNSAKKQLENREFKTKKGYIVRVS